MRKRCFITASVFLATSCSWGQSSLDRKITFDGPAMPVKRMMEAMSRACGIGFSSSPVVAPDVLVIRARNVTVRDLMARIATVEDATWKKEGDSYRLIRTSTQVRAQDAADRARKVEGYRRSIQKTLDSLKKQPPFELGQAQVLARQLQSLIARINPNDQTGNWYTQIDKVEQQGPFSQAIARICALIDPEDLADLEPQVKTVFSTAPTPSERPMDARVAEVVNQLVTDLKVWTEAANKYPVAQNTRFYTGALSQTRLGEGGVVKPVAKVLLSAFEYSAESGIQLNLMLVDAQGKFIAEAQGSVEWQQFEGNPTELLKSKPEDPKIVLSDDAKQLTAALDQRTPDQNRLSDSLLNRLSHPEQYEPLSLVASDVLMQVAELKKVNLVALVPDNLFSIYSLGRDKATTPGMFINFMGYNNAVEEKDGWLTLRPKNSAMERKNRCDRAALGQIIRMRMTGKRLDIVEQAEVAAMMPENQYDNLIATISRLVKGQGLVNQYSDQTMLKFYGLLSPEARTALTNGGLSFSQLPPAAIEVLRKQLYSQWSGLQYESIPPADGKAPTQADSERENSERELFWKGMYREVTECLPNGIPPAGKLTATVTEEDVVFPPDTARRGYIQPGYAMNASTLAWQMYSQAHTNLFPWMLDNDQSVNLSLLKFSRRVKIDLKFQFTDRISMQRSMEDSEPKLTEPTPFDQLPQAFRDDVNKQLADYAKSYENYQPSTYQGNNNGAPTPHPR